MIDRFNFYDVYGYLLPGLAITALLVLPLGMMAPRLPPAEFGSALAAGVIGYVIGHVQHAFANRLFSDRRPFADLVAALGNGDKARLAYRLHSTLGSAVEINDGRVFAICRRALQDAKRTQLADQFQGMYALTRGLAVAFWVAAAYYSGLALAGLRRQPPVTWWFLLLVLAGVAWLVVAWLNKDKKPDAAPPPKTWKERLRGRWKDSRSRMKTLEAAVALLALSAFGAIAGCFVPLHPHRFEVFAAAVPICALFALRMYRVFQEHDWNFARAVLTDFMIEPPLKPPAGGSPN